MTRVEWYRRALALMRALESKDERTEEESEALTLLRYEVGQ